VIDTDIIFQPHYNLQNQHAYEIWAQLVMEGIRDLPILPVGDAPLPRYTQLFAFIAMKWRSKAAQSSGHITLKFDVQHKTLFNILDRCQTRLRELNILETEKDAWIKVSHLQQLNKLYSTTSKILDFTKRNVLQWDIITEYAQLLQDGFVKLFGYQGVDVYIKQKVDGEGLVEVELYGLQFLVSYACVRYVILYGDDISHLRKSPYYSFLIPSDIELVNLLRIRKNA
jgi:hypothetical protein